jgi:hypothetical protein
LPCICEEFFNNDIAQETVDEINLLCTAIKEFSEQYFFQAAKNIHVAAHDSWKNMYLVAFFMLTVFERNLFLDHISHETMCQPFSFLVL